MRWIINVAAARRVVMDVLNLLKHHRFRLDRLRMATFLPKLMLLIQFVSQLIVLEFL